MTLKNKIISTCIIITSIILLTACQNNKYKKDISKIKNKTINNENLALSIDTFSTFPPEIDGCSCYFSNDSIEFKKEEYIYMNDFTENAFLKVNGILTKFKQTNTTEIDSLNTIIKYKSGNLNMTLEIKDGKQNGDETSLKTGKITLSDQNKKTITKTFYGECGC